MKRSTISMLLAASSVVAFASCADSSKEAAPTDPPSIIIDGGSLPDGAGADAACEAGTDGCSNGGLTCADVDFCPVPTGVDPRHALMGVWGSSKTDVWAVGSQGTILHWDGNAWTPSPSGTKQTLFAVAGTGPGDVWAVSSREVALHSTGFAGGAATWTKAPPVAPLYAPYLPQVWNESLLLAVLARTPSEVWLGGEPYPVLFDVDSPPANKNLWHYVEADGGRAWDGELTAEAVAIRGLWASGAGDVWAVGGGAGSVTKRAGRTFQGSGSTPVWTERDSQSTAALHAVWGSSANDVWAVGESGTVRHWANSATQRWDIVAVPTSHDLHAVWGTGPTDIWAAGDLGTILHFDGAEWRLVAAAFPAGLKPHLRGVWGSGVDDVWVVGDGITLHFSGKKAQ